MTRIIILRHGRPIVPPLRNLSAAEFSGWLDEYNAAGLCPTSNPTEDARTYASQCGAIVCSSLPRSIESAKVFSEIPIVFSDAIFNEAGLPISNWKAPRLSPKVWAMVFRLLWLFGYSRNTESFRQAKERASKAFEILTGIALEYGCVLFVGHGVYNRMLARELRRSGWSGPANPGYGHWDFGVYELNGNR